MPKLPDWVPAQSPLAYLVGGAALLVGKWRNGPDVLSPLVRAIRRLEPLGPILLSLFLVVCGVQHFVYHDFVITLGRPGFPRRGTFGSPPRSALHLRRAVRG